MEALCARIKMTYDKYIDQTVEALTSITEGRDTFQYTLKKQRETAEFVWKKHVPAEDITVRIMSFNVTMNLLEI